MPPKDEVLPAEEQPLPAALSPTADSPGYVPESDPKEDLEEDDDKDPEEDPADYPADGGDEWTLIGGMRSSLMMEDDDVDIEEEEYLAPADSTTVALLAVDHAQSAEETQPFKTDESAATPPLHPAYWVTARISILDEPLHFLVDTRLPGLLANLTPPPSPLSYSQSPRYRAAIIQLRAKAPVYSYSPLPHIILSHTRADTPPSGTPPLLPIPLPTSSPSLCTLAEHR
ncbi:hypothetical protein Tco_1437893 [Tanacetum coccineum]